MPVTLLGKILASITMLAGLCMFALPVGIIATAFAREIHNRDFVVTWSMVARVPIFQQLSAFEIAEVARLLRAQTIEPGALITRRGDRAFAMYFIASGTVEV
ncbi:cyclic nucleotide-binding domain-containing protein, partial [Mycobacterium tuberculosis]|nr:cyclic nucleotide-binding domain-containing protein [Mycobacterium tuberculosis]